MDPVDAAVGVADNLIPPEVRRLNGEAKWKIWVVGALVMTATSLTVHILAACGYLPFYPGFALAGDTEKVRVEVTAQMLAMEARMNAKNDSVAEMLKITRTNTLKKDLLDARQKQCKAPSGVVRSLMVEQIQNMQGEYEALTGKTYSLPTCDSF